MSPHGVFCPERGSATRSTSVRIGVLKLSNGFRASEAAATRRVALRRFAHRCMSSRL